MLAKVLFTVSNILSSVSFHSGTVPFTNCCTLWTSSSASHNHLWFAHALLWVYYRERLINAFIPWLTSPIKLPGLALLHCFWSWEIPACVWLRHPTQPHPPTPQPKPLPTVSSPLTMHWKFVSSMKFYQMKSACSLIPGVWFFLAANKISL